MFQGITNFASMLRQAQEMMGRLPEATEQLKAKRVTGTSGGGLVEVEANGAGEIRRVRIDPDLFARGDRGMIEDLLPAAVNQALEKARQLHMEMMQSMTQGMSVPGLSEALAQLSPGGPPNDEPTK
jgi:DNA-binding YbaB/EbfC family protein